MKQTFTIQQKMKQFGFILIPILITQLAMFSMSFFDIMMTGQYSPVHLAGVAIGSSIWVPVFTGLSGILLATSPIVAQLAGAKDSSGIRHSVIQGIYAAIALALFILMIGFFVLEPILDWMNLEQNVNQVAKSYLMSLAFGIVPLFVYNVLRAFIDALGKTRVTMMVTLSSLPINVLFNYLLIYGKLGFPELGGIGAGVASAITYWLITFIAAWIIHTRKPFIDFYIFRSLQKIDIEKWQEIFILGVPIGLSIFIETSIFSAVTMFISKFGTDVIAAHQAALNFSSLLYMIPLSISMALTIVVGYEVGARRLKDAKSYSLLGIFLAVLVSSTLGLLLFFFREPIAALYTDEQSVIIWTSQFLLYAVFFQLSDAIQAPIQGALRGYKDVNATFIMAMISFWVIGLPLGYVLANYTALGPFGFWFGLISGLAVGAFTLSFRLRYIQKKNEPGSSS